MPVYAKLSDVVGRKPIILIGIGLFLLGSILCGLAWSMPSLIAFRVLQGLGAGAVQPMAITTAGDIHTLTMARARTMPPGPPVASPRLLSGSAGRPTIC